MGLSICRSIIEAHDGHIEADNKSALGGARFSFSLPANSGLRLVETPYDRSVSGVIAAVARQRAKPPLRFHLYVDMSYLSGRWMGACASARRMGLTLLSMRTAGDYDRNSFGLLA